MHKRIPLSIIYPYDPLGTKTGGIESFIRGFIRYAPGDFEIELVGITEDPHARPVGARTESELGSCRFFSYPVLHVANPNVQTAIPLMLRFTAALLRHPPAVSGRLLEFHRLEPAMPFHWKPNKKLYFCHGNVEAFYSPFSESMWSRFPWLYFLMEKALLKNVVRAFVVNREGLAYYSNRYEDLSARFQFLPTWVDETVFYPLSPDEKALQKAQYCRGMDLPADSHLVLFAGRLEIPKNPLLLLEAFGLVREQDRRAILLIAGDGSLRRQMETFVQDKGLGESVRFLGIIGQEQLAETMRVCDLFLLTSAFEGMPMSVLESLASGLPVVSTAAGEIKQVVVEGYSGLVVEEGQPEPIARAVLSLIRGRQPIDSGNCVNAVRPYFVKNVLGPLYDYHYRLMGW